MASRLFILYHPRFCIILYRCYQGCYSLSATVLYHTQIDVIKATHPPSSNVLNHPSIDAIKAAILCQSEFCIILRWMLSRLLILHHLMFCIILYRCYQGCYSLSATVLYHTQIDVIKATHPPSSNVLNHPSIDAIKAAILCQSEFCIILRWMLSRLLILHHLMFCIILYRCYQGCYSLSARVLYHTQIDAIKATHPPSPSVLCHPLSMISRLLFSI